MFVNDAKLFYSQFSVWSSLLSLRHLQLTHSQKIIILSATAGLAVVTMVAKYLKRKKAFIFQSNKLSTYLKKKEIRSSLEGVSPNIQMYSKRSSDFSTLNYPDKVNAFSENSVLDAQSESVCASSSLTSQQLGLMGMEALETTINYWEEALATYRNKISGNMSLAVTNVEDAEFSRELQKILDAAYNLQEESELLFLDQRSVLFRTESSIKLFNDADVDSRASFSCAESFVSAQGEVADLNDFEEFSNVSVDFLSLPLYQSAIQQSEDSGIPFRCLRTEMVRCSSDLEYLGKLHCIRLAFRYIFKDKAMWLWFADSGRQLLADLILYADKDPKEFLIAYEDMLSYLQNKKNWCEFETELYAKEVKAMTFYDIVFDYILMDAFEDLESPPSSVTAVVQNRWLSDGFKETALATAVWSVLKAKRKMLKFPAGFMAHFYTISEQMSPLMAWGFLGPDEKLKDICVYFKNQVIEFLIDIFSFEKTRYTVVEELAEDVLKHIKFRINNITKKLGQEK